MHPKRRGTAKLIMPPNHDRKTMMHSGNKSERAWAERSARYADDKTKKRGRQKHGDVAWEIQGTRTGSIG
jgi:hypothetical protein